MGDQARDELGRFAEGDSVDVAEVRSKSLRSGPAIFGKPQGKSAFGGDLASVTFEDGTPGVVDMRRVTKRSTPVKIKKRKFDGEGDISTFTIEKADPRIVAAARHARMASPRQFGNR